MISFSGFSGFITCLLDFHILNKKYCNYFKLKHCYCVVNMDTIMSNNIVPIYLIFLFQFLVNVYLKGISSDVYLVYK